MERLLKMLLGITFPLFLLWLVSKALGSALLILVLAFASSYLLMPLFKRLERWRLPRALSAMLLFICFSGILSLVALLLGPFLFREGEAFFLALPSYLARAIDKMSEWLVAYQIPIPDDARTWTEYIKAHTGEILQKAASPLLKSVTQLISGTISILTLALNFILFPVFFLFLILDFEKIVLSLKSLIPEGERGRFESYGKALDHILSGFFRGQFLVCSFLSLFYGLGFLIVGVPYGLFIGLIGGFLSFIPYLGASFSLVTAMIVSIALDQSIGTIIGAGIIFAVAQTLESFVLTPRLVGNKVGLTPLMTILALIAGANLAGFVGILVAVPMAAILKVVLADVLKEFHLSLK